MSQADIEIPAKFKPRARLLLQLGDQLIRNESIALIELVKNAYDADANNVTIYMEGVDEPEHGVIIIEDDGHGMNAKIVEDVWLEPGSDFKSKRFMENQLSDKYHRLPIGEKGIGRFGVHKLGNIIEMTTKSKGSNEVFVKIDWRDFNNYNYLEDVPIKIIKRRNPKMFTNGASGTNITITSLRKKWERGMARNVKRATTSLVSPFNTIDSFKANFEVIDKPGWFDGLLEWKEVKDYSLYHFKVKISGNQITEFLYEFTPWASMPKLSERKVSLTENPESDAEKLVTNFRKLEYQEEKGSSKKEVSLDDHKIGEVTFEGYVFDQDPFILRLGVSDKKGYKDYLKTNGGVRVFRDGLRIYDYGEPENDWLDLDYRRFQMPSKSISNNLILAAIYIKREKSSDLIEKTNREGFVENEAYLFFKRATLHCIDLIESLRLTDKKRLRDTYGPTPKSEPVMHVLGDARRYVEAKVKEPGIKKQIVKYLVKIEDDYKRVNDTLLKAAGAGLSMSVVVHEVEKIVSELLKVLNAEDSSERVLNLVRHLSSLIDGYAEIVRKSTQTREDMKVVIEQALFNTEYRLNSHNIEVVKMYRDYSGQALTKTAKSLLIGSLMNVIDNSIFWLERANSSDKDLKKKLFVNIYEDENYLYLLVADNGPGFLLPTEIITEPFMSSKPGGIGLGLHIANEVMQTQGGMLIFPESGDFEIPEEFEEWGSSSICI